MCLGGVVQRIGGGSPHETVRCGPQEDGHQAPLEGTHESGGSTEKPKLMVNAGRLGCLCKLYAELYLEDIAG